MLIIGASTASYSQQTYRLQILKGTMKDIKKEAESFQQKHPGIKTFLTWESPYAYLSVGPCGKKSHALKLRKELKLAYPSSTLIKCNMATWLL